MNDDQVKNQNTKPLGISKNTLEVTLANNKTWISIPPTAPGTDLVAVSKLWKGEKAFLVNMILKDLEKCRENMSKYGEEYGNDYVVKVWSIIERQLAVDINFHAACGPIALWKNTYKKASRKVQQELPIPVGVAVAPVLRDLLNRSRKVASAKRVAI